MTSVDCQLTVSKNSRTWLGFIPAVSSPISANFSMSTPGGTFTIGFGPSLKRRQSLYSVEEGVGLLILLARVWLALAGVGQCPYCISTALGISTLSGAPSSACGTEISACPAWLNPGCS